jgi:hypothetical protein
MHESEIAARTKGEDVPQYVYPSSCDISVQGFRRWWVKYGQAAAPRNSFGPASPDKLKRLSRRDQIDPWITHTKHCSKCRSILRKAKRVETFSLIAAAVGAIFSSSRHPILACTMLAAGYLVNRKARTIVVALEGEPNPSQVNDRTSASAD